MLVTYWFSGTLWYALTLAGAAGGWRLSLRLFANPWAAWAGARLLGFGLSAYVAAVAGVLGFSAWAWLSLPLVLFGVGLAFPLRRQLFPLICELELVGFATFWLLAAWRAPGYAVMGTEKPMDLAILASLLRPQPLPPEDPWFAGFPLPYYHWGFVPWVLPAKLSGFFPDQLFNLLVPTVAALTAQLAYGWMRAVGASRSWGVTAAAFCVFLGTAEGWTQLFAGKAGFFTANLWEASRGIAHAITEFPLFTYHLGDLHPHLLCQPWVLLALMFWELSPPLPRVIRLGVGAFMFGIAVATNPWAGPLLGLAVLAIGVARAQRWCHGVSESLCVVFLALVLFFPAWRHLPAAASGLGLVHTPTTFGEALRVLLPATFPLLAFSFWFFHRRFGTPGLFLAGGAYTVLAALTARPVLALAVTCGAALVSQAWREGQFRLPALLAGACLVALAGMEIVYVKDPYGPQWYRMNTVFKTLSFVFLVLPVPSLRLLLLARFRGWRPAPLAALIPWLLTLPQLATVTRAAWPLPQSFAGLHWMAPGEAEAARFVHRTAKKDVLVEAVGEAYSDAARMSSCSGVPTVLGWENHEALWRPRAFAPLFWERKRKIQALYRCSDPACVRELARDLGATIVVVGAVERRLYPELKAEALEAAGEVIFKKGVVTLVRVGPGGT